MVTAMRKVLLIVLLALASYGVSAQIKMSIVGNLKYVEEDLDASSYYRQTDVNDQVCAIIKVKPDFSLSSLLVLHTRGGLLPIAPPKGISNYREDAGEWWYWVSPTITNISFTCEGYTPTDYIGVSLSPGSVYRLDLAVESSVTLITSFNGEGLSGVKMTVFPKDAIVSYGTSPDRMINSIQLEDGYFDVSLSRGKYYFTVERDLYETYTKEIELDKKPLEINVSLTPAYGMLKIDSSPSNADVYIDGKRIGKTPINETERLSKGVHSLRVRLDNYYVVELKVSVAGNGSVYEVPTVNLAPQFGTVTLQCEDRDADLIVTDSSGKVLFKGKSGSSTQLNSQYTYKLEATRASHASQSRSIIGREIEGKTVTVSVKAPVPLYGGISISSNPTRADVYIDGVLVGTTLYADKLLIGRHTVELKKAGYYLEPFAIEINKDETLQLNKKLFDARLRMPDVTVKTENNSKRLVNGLNVNKDGSDIVISYNLNERSDVSVSYSQNGEKKRTDIPSEFLSGDIGKRISKGDNHSISWHILDQNQNNADLSKKRFDIYVRCKPSPCFFVLVNWGYSLDSGFNVGATVGQLGQLGWYLKGMSTLAKPRGSEFECDENGLVDGSLPAYSGIASKFKAYGVAGMTLRLGLPIYLTAGVGYGSRVYDWETTDGRWVKNVPGSYSGFAIDAGAIFKMGSFALSAGVTTIGGSIDLCAGLGFVF